MPPRKEELEAVFGQAIANLNAQLNSVAEAPQPQQQQSPQEGAVQVDVSRYCCIGRSSLSLWQPGAC
jgi:hypothetical protein